MKKKINLKLKELKSVKFASFAAIFLLLFGLVFAVSKPISGPSGTEGYLLSKGDRTTFIQRPYWDLGIYVDNNCDKDLLIPMKTIGEYSSFFANKPSCIVIRECVRPALTLNSGRSCKPTGSIYKGYNLISQVAGNNRYYLHYCPITTASVVGGAPIPEPETVESTVDFQALSQAKKLEAEVAIADLEYIIANPKGAPDDGLPIQLADAKEFYNSGVSKMNAGDYASSVTDFSTAATIAINAPLNTKTYADLKGEATSNKAEARAVYDALLLEVTDYELYGSVEVINKVTLVKEEMTRADSFFISAEDSFAQGKEQDAKKAMSDSIDSSNNLVDVLAPDVRAEVLSYATSLKNTATSDKDALISYFNSVDSSIQETYQSQLNSLISDYDAAIVTFNAPEYIYAMGEFQAFITDASNLELAIGDAVIALEAEEQARRNN